MIADEQEKAKERAIETRAWGGSLKDCAIAAGVTDDTITNWKKDKDSDFSEKIELALLNFKKSLVKGVRAKKPEFILERKWKDEYGIPKEDNTGNVTNVLIVGDEQLSKLLYGFTKRLTNAEDQDSTEDNAVSGETTTGNGSSK